MLGIIVTLSRVYDTLRFNSVVNISLCCSCHVFVILIRGYCAIHFSVINFERESSVAESCVLCTATVKTTNTKNILFDTECFIFKWYLPQLTTQLVPHGNRQQSVILNSTFQS